MGFKILTREFDPSKMPSHEYNAETGECSIEWYIAAKEPFRVTPGDTLPFEWPFQAVPSEQESIDVVASIKEDYKKVLKNHGIQPDHCTVEGYIDRGYYRRLHQEILVINTKDEDTTSWNSAINEVQRLLDEIIPITACPIRVHAEIRNQDKMQKPFILPPISFRGINADACLAIDEFRDAISDKAEKLFSHYPSYTARGVNISAVAQYWHHIQSHEEWDDWANEGKPTMTVLLVRGLRHK